MKRLPLVVLLTLSGCSKQIDDPEVAKKYLQENPILKVAQLYGSFSTENQRPPADIEELKAWAKSLAKDRLDLMGITDVDAVCVSPRDNKPYRIAPPPRSGMPRVMIYEAEGVNGRRMTSGMGSTSEMDENQLRGHVPNLK